MKTQSPIPQSAADRGPVLDVREIGTPEAFRELAAEWEDLRARGPHPLPFLSHAWLTSWWDHFGNGHRPAIVLGREAGRLIFAFPLMEEKVGWGPFRAPVLRSMTNVHSFRGHYLAESGREHDAVVALWHHLRARPRPWHALFLSDVPEDAPARLLHEDAVELGTATGIWKAVDSPYVTLQPTWDAYLKTLTSKFRSNLRRRRRRLEESGPVSFEVLTSPRDEDLDDAFRLEALAWKGSNHTAILSNPTVTGFYRDFLHKAAALGWLRLAFLDVGGRRIATDLSLAADGKVWCMKIGYDPEFAACSPGQLLAEEMLRRTHGGELGTAREYDFLGPVTQQKRDWTEEMRPIRWIYLYNRTLVGRLMHLYKFRLVPAVKHR